jgi:hypothetical protein
MSRTPTCPSWSVIISITICVVALQGCGREGLPTYPVTGRVVFPDGRPLRGGSIIFQSTQHPVTARGPIGDDGSINLGTYEVGDGAVAGEHRVAVLPPKPQRDTDEGIVLTEIDVKYQNPQRSELVCDVQPDGENQFEITVTSPPASGP